MDRRDARSLPRPAWAVALALALVCLIAPATAGAATISVNTTSDVATNGDGLCSLREAVNAAATDDSPSGDCVSGSGPDTIVLPHGTYTLAGAAGEDLNASGDLDVRDVVGDGSQQDVTFQGAGDGTNLATDTIIDANGVDRAIDVQDDGPTTGIDAAVNDVTIENGSVTGDGGGVRMQDTNGTVTVNRSTIQDSDATGDGGGLVMKGGTNGQGHQVQIIDSELDGNTAGGEGGGLFVQTASPDPTGSNSVEVDGSTLSGNGSTDAGGAIYAESPTRLDLLNSTVSANTAGGGGGAVAMGLINHEFHSQFSTIADNSTTLAGGAGGIQTDSDTDQVYLEGTILSSNLVNGSAANCAEIPGAGADGTFVPKSLGYSLESADTCGLDGTGDLVNRNPMLTGLADNGGPTRTIALLPVSPALDLVPDSPTDYCHYTEVPGGTPVTVNLTTDQRGEPRPTAAGGLCDVGAWEGQPPSSSPAITDTDPDSPGNSLNPAVKGTASVDSTALQVFSRPGCTGSPAADTSVDDFENAGITVTVLPNQTNALSARALSADGLPSACSGNFTYVHDAIALTPAITATNPASGADENSPSVIGTAEVNSTVRIYAAGSCPLGMPLASGPQAVFTGTGLIVTVADNSTTSLVASYTDAAGNVSACSSSFTYNEVTPAASTPAPTPTPAAPKKKCKKKGRAAATKKCKKK
jgi:CSLREA domain-containing protein